MDSDVRKSNAALNRQLHVRYCGGRLLRVRGLQLGRRGTDERAGHRVISRIAALEMSPSVVRMTWRRVVLMRRGPMTVLRVIVAVVGVRVQQRRQARRHNQRRDEQQRQGAVHVVSV